ncbi:uncharacterized protein YjbI with pentapeptide repeats [Saccharothrix tamanrassetensis]|uniref:Uncharacterized protein YjbI with pentapeptide repeats n=1 Tax=Saccharothrix tamanrassetensis TaxID=1051531 RepID=A0A841CDU2_9PSEU|nr:pentapeptide repeat-containing protein [Saccharothrix tamanrassetensis]MBB5954338.1 uncharacterized protein YjbI with pentapeptide repeats [Saccharothrix tamanrassetensis]
MYRVLTTKTITLAAVLLVSVGVGLAVALLWAYGGGTEADKARLDAIRTAGTIVVGTGGAAALWLAARRQQSAEIALRQKDVDQEHQERVALAVQVDAAERRVTELYTKAVEQLGSDKAPVRLGGMYALERLAQNVPEQRQTIVNVLCAYLRMPPPTENPNENPTEDLAGAQQVGQERQVRLTAQRILRAHLRWGTKVFWPDVDLDLTGATLHDLDLVGCRVRTARFHGARFTGFAAFGGAWFAGKASFGRAEFHGRAVFEGARFAGNAVFGEAVFHGEASFTMSGFAGEARFDHGRFEGKALFGGAQFARGSVFGGACFEGSASFGGVECHDDLRLEKTRFACDATFEGARLRRNGLFTEAEFADAVTFKDVEFGGSAMFGESVFGGKAVFDGAWFGGMVRFDHFTSYGGAAYGGDRGLDEEEFDQHAPGWFMGAGGGGLSWSSGMSGRARFAMPPTFSGARARVDTDARHVWPDGVAESADGDVPDRDVPDRDGVWAHVESRDPAA